MLISRNESINAMSWGVTSSMYLNDIKSVSRISIHVRESARESEMAMQHPLLTQYKSVKTLSS